MELNGKVALVTGGAVRIGRAMALALAERGVRIAIHYGSHHDEALETTAAILKMGVDAESFQADLRSAEAAPRLIESVAAHFGQIDILVNSAALFKPGGIFDTTEENWDAHFAVNLKSPFFLASAFARLVGKDRPGLIVNIADWRAFRPGPDYMAYTITKAGIITMTQSLALALSPNIRVNAIAPGAILPPPGRDASYLDQLAERLPLKRQGSPEEVVKGLIYLVEADFVTGEVLFIDGGEHL